MKEDFQSSVRKLFQRLKLAEPRFGDTGGVRLRIESMAVDLRDSGTDLVVIEGLAGRLSGDPSARAGQIRKILDTNLGLLLESEASVYIKPAAAGETAVAVRATYDLRSSDQDGLVKKIEDVIKTMEYYSADLTLAARPSPPARSQTVSDFEPAIIFRP